VSGEQERSPDELVAEVSQIYPEAEEAFQKHGAPWAVDDPALAEAIRSAYIRHYRQ
jgi:methionine synthase II (cobalamin-independent)